MAQIVEVVETGSIGNSLFKVGTRVWDQGAGKRPAGQTNKKTQKAKAGHVLSDHLPAWRVFCSKAQFFGLQQQDLDLLLQVGRLMHTRDSQQLFCEGESNDSIFLILEGQVKLGKTLSKPFWLNMGPYGMIDLSDEKEPVWGGYQICAAGHCLGGGPLTSEACHSLTAASVGECDLLVVETATLERQLRLQGRSSQYLCIMASLRQMSP